MIHALAKRTSVSVLFASERPLVVPYHWIGRSVLCAGDGCPACKLRSPKAFFYAAGVSERQLQVFELCASLAHKIDGLCATVCRESWRGVVLRASRSSKRHEWKIENFTIVEGKAAEATEAFLVKQVATLLRVRSLFDGESVKEWLASVRASQIPILQGAQLI